MATFYCFVYSGSTMMAQMALGMVTGDEKDPRYRFFKNATLHLPYANQPAQTVDGRALPFSAVCQAEGQFLLVIPSDVEPHLPSFKSTFTLVARVPSESSVPAAIFKFLDTVKFE